MISVNHPYRKVVLIADDDDHFLSEASKAIIGGGYQVVTAYDGDEALLLAQWKEPDLIVANVWMPSMAGFLLAVRLRESAIRVPLIFVTTSRQSHLKELARTAGGIALLQKPMNHEMLVEIIKSELDSDDVKGREFPVFPVRKERVNR